MFRGQFDEHGPCRGRHPPQLTRHPRCGLASERPRIERRSVGVGQHESDAGGIDAEFFCHDLRKGSADVLTDFNFPGIDRDVAVFTDVQPGADLARRRAAAAAAPPAALELLCGRLLEEQEHQHAAAEEFDKVAAVEIELPAGRLEQLVALRLDLIRQAPGFIHGSPRAGSGGSTFNSRTAAA